MKIAFCFSGQLRSFEKTFPFIKQYILDKITDYDVFCSVDCEDDLEAVQVLSPMTAAVCPPLPDKDLQLFESLLNRRYLWMENNEKNSLKNYLSQLWKLKHSFSLLESSVEDSGIYDFVVRLRYDYLPIDGLKIDEIKNICANSILIPHADSRVHGNVFLENKLPLNDMFGIGSVGSMKYYFRQYDYFMTVINGPSVNLDDVDSTMLKLFVFIYNIISSKLFVEVKILQKFYYFLNRNIFRVLLRKYYIERAMSPGVVLRHVLILNKVEFLEYGFNYIVLRKNCSDRSLIILGNGFY